MSRGWKIPVYLFLFGLLALVGVIWKNPQLKEYSPAQVLGTKTNISLFIEPDDGKQKLLELINSAKNQIFVEVYLLSDPEVILALKEAQGRGVKTQVMLEQHPFGGGNLNPKTKLDLENFGVGVVWSNPSFTLTHEKTVIVDGRIVCILNMNLSKTAFEKNREYNACDENQEDVNEAQQIFLADWVRQEYDPKAENLVVSPQNSRGKLTALIKGATKSLDVEMEVLQDPLIIDLTAQKAKEISVRIILPPLSRVDTNKAATEKIGGIKFLGSPYVHAKLIVADKERVYLGSVNLSTQSMEQNRELGILISQPDVVQRIGDVFEIDWINAKN